MSLHTRASEFHDAWTETYFPDSKDEIIDNSIKNGSDNNEIQ